MARARIACLLCNSTFSKGQLYGHISEHFNFHRYRCVNCDFSASFSDDVANHAMEEDHNVEPEDDCLANPYVHQLVNLVVSQSRTAAVSGATSKILQDLETCYWSYESRITSPAADTQISCLICGSAVANSELHVGLKHFNGFVRFQCSDCPFKAPLSRVVVNHALERDHNPNDPMSLSSFIDPSIANSNAALVHSPDLSVEPFERCDASEDSSISSPEDSAATTPIDPTLLPQRIPPQGSPVRPLAQSVDVAAIKQDRPYLDLQLTAANAWAFCALCPAGANGLPLKEKETHVFRHAEVNGMPMASSKGAFYDDVARVWLQCFPDDAPAEANNDQGQEYSSEYADADLQLSEVICNEALVDDAQLVESGCQTPKNTAVTKHASNISRIICKFSPNSTSVLAKRPASNSRLQQPRLKQRRCGTPATRIDSAKKTNDRRRRTADSISGAACVNVRVSVKSNSQKSALDLSGRTNTCTKCGETIAAPSASVAFVVNNSHYKKMRRHVWRKHASTLPYRCNLCAYSHSNCREMKFHLKKHHPGAPADSYKDWTEEERMRDMALFRECFPAFIQAKSESAQKNRQSQTRSGYICNRCSAQISSGRLAALERHVSECHHPGLNKQQFQCSSCGFVSVHRTSARRHIMTQHADDKYVQLLTSCSGLSSSDKRKSFAACFPDCLRLFDAAYSSARAPRATSKFSSKSSAKASRNRSGVGADLASISGVSKLQMNEDGSTDDDAERESDSPFLGSLAEVEQTDDDFPISIFSGIFKESPAVDCKPIVD